jgi:hypothetical protein
MASVDFLLRRSPGRTGVGSSSNIYSFLRRKKQKPMRIYRETRSISHGWAIPGLARGSAIAYTSDAPIQYHGVGSVSQGYADIDSFADVSPSRSDLIRSGRRSKICQASKASGLKLFRQNSSTEGFIAYLRAYHRWLWRLLMRLVYIAGRVKQSGGASDRCQRDAH